ncbi:hypothetical protein PMAYCL1PPCAC_08084, partial [Pristionchus mayeri]
NQIFKITSIFIDRMENIVQSVINLLQEVVVGNANPEVRLMVQINSQHSYTMIPIDALPFEPELILTQDHDRRREEQLDGLVYGLTASVKIGMRWMSEREIVRRRLIKRENVEFEEEEQNEFMGFENIEEQHSKVQSEEESSDSCSDEDSDGEESDSEWDSHYSGCSSIDNAHLPVEMSKKKQSMLGRGKDKHFECKVCGKITRKGDALLSVKNVAEGLLENTDLIITSKHIWDLTRGRKLNAGNARRLSFVHNP